LIQLRRTTPLVRRNIWLHGLTQNSAGWNDIEWLRPDGSAMQASDWQSAAAFSLLLVTTQRPVSATESAIAVLFNSSIASVHFCLPAIAGFEQWQVEFATNPAEVSQAGRVSWILPGHSLVYLELSTVTHADRRDC